MSVYHEALMSGRLHTADIVSNGGSIRRALKAVKRREAEERNAKTPVERTKRYRRELAAELAEAAAKRRVRR